jgi:hypothetical protein
VGLEKVAGFTTDSAPNMVAARRLLGQREDCQHMIIMPCMMHGFALILKSVLAHPEAAKLVADAQRIVTFFEASHQPQAFLLKCAKEVNITTKLQSSCQTRITSVHYSFESLLTLESAFKKLLEYKDKKDPSFPPTLLEAKKRWLLERLASRTFWSQLECLCKLLQPLTQVIIAVQSATATLCDLTR